MFEWYFGLEESSLQRKMKWALNMNENEYRTLCGPNDHCVVNNAHELIATIDALRSQ